jgi:hypothetical protein
LASKQQLRIAIDMLAKDDGLTAAGKLVDLMRYYPPAMLREVIADKLLSVNKAGKGDAPAHPREWEDERMRRTVSLDEMD